MKLFQRLLIAPATLGLLAPLAVNATEVNLNAISDYSDDQVEFDSKLIELDGTKNKKKFGAYYPFSIIGSLQVISKCRKKAFIRIYS